MSHADTFKYLPYTRFQFSYKFLKIWPDGFISHFSGLLCHEDDITDCFLMKRDMNMDEFYYYDDLIQDIEDWEKFVSFQEQLKYDLQKVFHNPSVDLDLGGPGKTIKLSLIDPDVGSWEYKYMYPSTDIYIENKKVIMIFHTLQHVTS